MKMMVRMVKMVMVMGADVCCWRSSAPMHLPPPLRRTVRAHSCCPLARAQCRMVWPSWSVARGSAPATSRAWQKGAERGRKGGTGLQ